jgi:hypothetical protein
MEVTKQAMHEAKAWLQRLGKKSITTAELYEFTGWRDDPANDAAYSVVEKDWMRSRGRFVMLPASSGFDVIDSWTGEPATFANAPMSGLSEEDADAVVELLNTRTRRRSTRQ